MSPPMSPVSVAKSMAESMARESRSVPARLDLAAAHLKGKVDATPPDD